METTKNIKRFYTVETSTRQMTITNDIILIHSSIDTFYGDDLLASKEKALECYYEKIDAASLDESIANPSFERHLFTSGKKKAWSIELYLNIESEDDLEKIDVFEESMDEDLILSGLV